MRFAITFLTVCLYLVKADACTDQNATLKECKNNCPPTCENPDGSEICIDVCVPGCDCNEGFVCFENNCIPKKHCCEDRNATYTICGTACPLTCANPIEEICIRLCVYGCACKSGYVLNAVDKCILLADC